MSLYYEILGWLGVSVNWATANAPFVYALIATFITIAIVVVLILFYANDKIVEAQKEANEKTIRTQNESEETIRRAQNDAEEKVKDTREWLDATMKKDREQFNQQWKELASLCVKLKDHTEDQELREGAEKLLAKYK